MLYLCMLYYAVRGPLLVALGVALGATGVVLLTEWLRAGLWSC